MKRQLKRDSKALSTVFIIAIVLVAMVIATALIFVLLPTVEKQFGGCADVCNTKTTTPVVQYWTDCENNARRIVYYPNGITEEHSNTKWEYVDSGYSSYYNPYTMKTLQNLINRVRQDYENGVISEASWTWFKCTAEAIS